jgi:hypothetical protein
MITPLEYDGIVKSSRNYVAWLCLALLLLAALTPFTSLLLWAIVLPLCFVFALVIAVAFFGEGEGRPSPSESDSLLPARAPPLVS